MVRKLIVAGILLGGVTRIFADAVQFNAMDMNRMPIGENMTITVRRGTDSNTKQLSSGGNVTFVLPAGRDHELCVKAGGFSKRYKITVKAQAPGEMRTQVVRNVFFTSERQRLQPISGDALVTIKSSYSACSH